MFNIHLSYLSAVMAVNGTTEDMVSARFNRVTSGRRGCVENLGFGAETIAITTTPQPPMVRLLRDLFQRRS
jgi:hypothetical protein